MDNVIKPKRGDFATHAEYNKALYIANKAEINARNNAYYKKNYQDNREFCLVKRAAWKRGTHPQFSKEIRRFYAEARRKTRETGVLYVVDHIWPLKGKNSCGLHVSWNMQIITSEENDRKGNKEPSTW